MVNRSDEHDDRPVRTIVTHPVSRRTVLAGAAVAGGAAMVAGGAVRPAPASAQEPVTISLWWPIDSTNQDWDAALELIAGFEAANPDVKVEPQTVSFEQLENRLVVASQGGSLPDVAWALAENVPTYQSLGLLADYTDKWAAWAGSAGIADNIKAGAVFDGKTMSVMPQYLGIRNYQYHASQFEEAGVAGVPATWDDLIAAGLALKEVGYSGFAFCGSSVRLPQELVVYLWQNNLEIAVDTGGGVWHNTWADNPAEMTRATEVFQFYYDLLFAHGIAPRDVASWGYEQLDEGFATGGVSSAVDGPWIQSYEASYPDEMADVQFGPIPYKLTPATFLEVNYNVMFANSPHPEQAWRFLQYIGGPEGQAGPFYNYRTVRSDVTPPDSKWSASFLALAEQGKTWPQIPLGSIPQSMIDAVQSVLLEQATPAEAAQKLSEQINTALVEQGNA